MVLTPASRSSFTSRSCKVLCARSTRPFACGLFAQMMATFSSCSARPNWVVPSPPAASGWSTRKMPCLVRVEGDRLAVRLDVGAGGRHVGQRALGRHEPQVDEAAGRVGDEDAQRAGGPAVLDAGVLAAVDLDQLAEAVSAVARLVDAPAAGLARHPQAGPRPPPAPRLAGQAQGGG